MYHSPLSEIVSCIRPHHCTACPRRTRAEHINGSNGCVYFHRDWWHATHIERLAPSLSVREGSEAERSEAGGTCRFMREYWISHNVSMRGGHITFRVIEVRQRRAILSMRLASADPRLNLIQSSSWPYVKHCSCARGNNAPWRGSLRQIAQKLEQDWADYTQSHWERSCPYAFLSRCFLNQFDLPLSWAHLRQRTQPTLVFWLALHYAS